MSLATFARNVGSAIADTDIGAVRAVDDAQAALDTALGVAPT